MYGFPGRAALGRRLLRHGQVHDELAALAEPRAARLDVAAVHPDEVAHDRQPDAEPAARPVERRVALREEVEDEGQEIGRDADPRVPDPDRDAVALALRRQPDGATPRRVLGGVAQQIADDLRQTRRIGVEAHRVAGQRDRERMAARVDARADHLDRLLDDRGQQDQLLAERDLPLGNARHVEQVVDEPREVPHLPLGHLDDLGAVGALALEEMNGRAERR